MKIISSSYAALVVMTSRQSPKISPRKPGFGSPGLIAPYLSMRKIRGKLLDLVGFAGSHFSSFPSLYSSTVSSPSHHNVKCAHGDSGVSSSTVVSLGTLYKPDRPALQDSMLGWSGSMSPPKPRPMSATSSPQCFHNTFPSVAS